MSTINDYFIQAEFSLASYGSFGVGAIPLEKLTGNDVKMSASQAEQFAATYTVAAQYTDPATGVSATVFQDAAGKKYLAIRGTELAASDLLADGILALGIPSSLNPQFNALKTQIGLWLQDPAVLKDQTFTVSGHSLGGYLAAAVKQSYTQATDAYLFNAPGVGGPLGNLADVLTSALGLSGTPAGNIWNIRSSEGFPVVTGLGYQLGTSISIQTEAASYALANHLIAPLTDALAAQAIYSQLDPALTQDQLNAIVDASGTAANRTFEDALDALRKIILGNNLTPSPLATDAVGRGAFYTNLYALEQSTPFQNLKGQAIITPLAGMTATGIVAAAQNDIAVRYALYALNPFALYGTDYSQHNANGVDYANHSGVRHTDSPNAANDSEWRVAA